MFNAEGALKGKVKPLDPPDEPTGPQLGLVMKSILARLPELTPAELYYLKGAVVDEQEERESRAVLEGSGMRRL